jgi:hypothetical protein
MVPKIVKKNKLGKNFNLKNEAFQQKNRLKFI